MSAILIVDDEENIRKGLKANFEMEDYEVKTAENGSIALDIVKHEKIDCVVTDLRMPGRVSGEEVLRTVLAEHPGLPVIVLTGHGSVDSAVEAMRAGAFDFLTKPLDLENLNNVVKKAIKSREKKQALSGIEALEMSEKSGALKNAASRASAASKKENHESLSLGKIFTSSEKMMDVLRMVKKVSKTDNSVLLTGETGVGKEEIANVLHALSKRSEKPFVKVNCSAFNSGLLESELFGHEKGAFTGADKVHKGCFEQANGGTLFLDEIGEISGEIQVKLLRVLQEKKIQRLGGEKEIFVDIRIVSATNKNLSEAMEKGDFRSDLYYRLNQFPIEVPPLRSRKEDISYLAKLFLNEFNIKNETEIKGFSDEAKNIILNYDWPGNIRELQNCIVRSAVMCDGEEIKKEDLPAEIAGAKSSGGAVKETAIQIPLGSTIEEAEGIIIKETLKSVAGNKSQAAKILGLNRKTLQRFEKS